VTHTSQVEIERKYDVATETAVPELAGVGAIARVEEPETIGLEAVYFDTAGLALAGAKVALRRREGGADEGWHIKLPAGMGDDEGRTELHWPLGTASAATEVPAEVRGSVAQLVGGAMLGPIARIRNRRITRHLLDADGNALAEISDDHVSADDLLTGTQRTWREWEVELLKSAPNTRELRTELLDAIESALLAVGAFVSPSSSKLARALGRG
jgi:inorganic triphosphatase YgiF